MRFLPASGHKRMPWKNGKGMTTEIAVHPSGASVADFEWRISTASVAEDGAFSLFEGVDRTLAVLSGEGIDLLVGQASPVRLHKNSLPFRFPADEATSAVLLDGAITDLNVMTRRGRWEHDVARFALEGALSLSIGAEVVLIIGHEGLVRVCTKDEEQPLGPLDAVVTSGGSFVLQSDGQGCSFFIVTLGFVS
ncbi:HutD family protein [Tianweitania sediminis]|uniref:HutD family protein n=2 Tax=Tianweitania sediminis TaxID=1502156 RepID=A0A8J7RHQ3_9HYPH|nr:HutD family protein [Tianweitania sediminis]